MLKLKLQYFWSADMNSWLFGKVPDAGKDWRQKEKRAAEDKMAGWHHWNNGHELGQSSRDGEGQEGQACWSPWGHKESDKTGRLNNNNSACKLNKQGDNTQPWCTPFPIWNQSAVPCPVLTIASWPVYRFLKRQVRWSDIPISLRIFHSLLWSTQSKALA